MSSMKSFVRKHKGPIAISVAGPLEYDVFITKSEALKATDYAEKNGCEMYTVEHGNHLYLTIIDKR